MSLAEFLLVATMHYIYTMVTIDVILFICACSWTACMSSHAYRRIGRYIVMVGGGGGHRERKFCNHAHLGYKSRPFRINDSVRDQNRLCSHLFLEIQYDIS